jgi:hypothetical protein
MMHCQPNIKFLQRRDQPDAALPDYTQHSQERDILAPRGIRLEYLDYEEMFANKIRRNVASVERRRGFWKVYSAITDIAEIVYFLVRNFNFNVSYEANNAIFFHAVTAVPILLAVSNKPLA